MIANRRLTLRRLTALVTILFCLGGSACLAQRDRGGARPAPTTTPASDADAIRQIMRRRLEAYVASRPGDVDVPDALPPRKGPLDINTLKYVLIDPQTRVATFIGKYDPAYATGPLPYADLLQDALNNAYPAFSLEPTPEQRAQFDQADKVITADVNRMNDAAYCVQWAQKLLDLLLYDPSLTVDSKRFFGNLGAGMAMTGDELKRLYDVSAGKIEIPLAESFGLAAKMMRGIGAPKAADGLLALASGGAPEELLGKMARALGLVPQFEALERRMASGELSARQFRNEAIILDIGEMCRQFEAPESAIQKIAADIRSGAQATDALTTYMGEQMGTFIANRAGMRMVNGLVLGPGVLTRIYNLPTPQSELVFTNVAPESALGNILFKADYRLKSICAYPDARERVPGHLTSQGFMQQEAAARGYRLPGGVGAGIGHALAPGNVRMRVSPAGDVVEFVESRVKVEGWVRDNLGNRDAAAEAFISQVTPKYGDFLTQHYGEYAAVYPEWHKMSEVAKIVALVRWARQNNYTLKVVDASGAKLSPPKYVTGFWSAVFMVEGEKASLTLVEEGGATFSQEHGEGWVQPQPDVTVTADVSKQLVASAVLAQQSVNALQDDNLEAARDLAEKSARAMTGEIDLTQLPSLDGIPVPGEPAAYAAATAEVINQASACLTTMDTAQKDLARAGQLAATSPDEAAALTRQATQAQDEAQAKLRNIMGSVSHYRNDPSSAGAVAIALRGNTAIVAPIGGTTSTGTTVAASPTTGTTVTQPVDWSAKSAQWIAELEQTNKQIASTRGVLLRLNASIQMDAAQFAEWEKAASDGMDRCVGIATDTAIDFGAGALADRYATIHDLAQKLPDKPEDVIEKYRYLASLAQRLKEAKSTNDVAGLAQRENKTEAEIWESLRDGIGQISGLLGLDKTVPGVVWKYGSLACDMAYNLTELRQGWKNVGTLEANNVRYAEAVRKLSERMQALVERQKQLRQQIEAGEPVNFSAAGPLPPS